MTPEMDMSWVLIDDERRQSCLERRASARVPSNQPVLDCDRKEDIDVYLQALERGRRGSIEFANLVFGSSTLTDGELNSICLRQQRDGAWYPERLDRVNTQECALRQILTVRHSLAPICAAQTTSSLGDRVASFENAQIVARRHLST